MIFEAVCHAKCKELSLDFIVNVICCMQIAIKLHRNGLINDICDKISLLAIPIT